MIGLAKKAIAQVLGWPQVLLTDEELVTLFREVQAYLNNRPLGEVGGDLHDGPPIRSSDFLLTGNPVVGLPFVDGQDDFVPREGRKQVDLALTQVRKRFMEGYVPWLGRIGKAFPSDRVEVGDVVHVVHPYEASRSWPVGQVVETIPGVDGEVQKVKMKTSGGIMVRSIQDILVIPQISFPHPERLRGKVRF